MLIAKRDGTQIGFPNELIEIDDILDNGMAATFAEPRRS
jgi:hypothetical protein